MPDDEPLDDLRAIAMTAGAAAARVVETVVRDAQNRAQQTAQQAMVDAHGRQATHRALSAVNTDAPTTDNPSAQLPYDSPARRAALDQAMRAAGVP